MQQEEHQITDVRRSGRLTLEVLLLEGFSKASSSQSAQRERERERERGKIRKKRHDHVLKEYDSFIWYLDSIMKMSDFFFFQQANLLKVLNVFE